MNLKLIWIAVVVMVAGIVAIGARHVNKAPALTTETPGDAAEPAVRESPRVTSGSGGSDLERRVEELADEVGQLREEVARQRTKAQQSDPSRTGETEPSPEEQKALWDEHMSLVEAGFNEEATDAHWAGEVSSRIQRALAAHPSLYSATRSTECRARTCRVELDTDAQGKLTDEIADLTVALGEQLPTVLYDHIEEPGGRQTQVLYFRRERAGDTSAE